LAATASRAPHAEVSWGMLRRTPHFVLFVAAIFGLQLVDRSFGPILPLYLRETGQSAANVPFLSGLLFSITAGSAALGNQVTGWLLPRTSVVTLIATGTIAAALAAAAFGAGAPLVVLIAGSVLLGAGLGMATTAIYTGATSALPSTARGAGFSYLTRAYLVGLAVSPPVAGLVGAWSMRAVFIADAAALVGIAWILHRRMKGR
jgi:DHA1 family tetracycline resistance protein-like MFS transporter